MTESSKDKKRASRTTKPPQKEWKDYTRKEKRDVYVVFATIGVFIISWLAADFISAIVMVLFGYFVYYIVNIFRHKQYRKNNTIGAAVFFVLLAISTPFVPEPDPRSSAEPNTKQIQQQAEQKADEQERLREIEAARPVVKTETKVEAVPFESTERNDGTIPAGEKRLSVAGVAGERTITYDVTYVKGKETTRTEAKSEVTKAPVAQVTLNGTYVKPVPAPAPRAAASSCDPNYSGCVPNVSYDLDCGDIGFSVRVLGSDKHKFDRDRDGYGCESY